MKVIETIYNFIDDTKESLRFALMLFFATPHEARFPVIGFSDFDLRTFLPSGSL